MTINVSCHVSSPQDNSVQSSLKASQEEDEDSLIQNAVLSSASLTKERKKTRLSCSPINKYIFALALCTVSTLKRAIFVFPGSQYSFICPPAWLSITYLLCV